MAETPMRERIARAIAPDSWAAKDDNDGHVLMRAWSVNQADAVLAAMEEATEAMVDAYCENDNAKAPMGDVCLIRWRAMIRAAREGK